jgi:hypothetical protein
MSEDYVFIKEWLARQSEPLDDGGTFFDDPVPSPLAIDRIPDRQTKQLFNPNNERTKE